MRIASGPLLREQGVIVSPCMDPPAQKLPKNALLRSLVPGHLSSQFAFFLQSRNKPPGTSFFTHRLIAFSSYPPKRALHQFSPILPIS